MELQIKGEKYTLRWGILSIEKFCDDLGMDISEAFTQLEGGVVGTMKALKALRNLIIADINTNYGVEVSHSDIAEIIDQRGQEFINDVLQSFKDSYLMGKTISEWIYSEDEKEEKPENKKKAHVKKASAK